MGVMKCVNVIRQKTVRFEVESIEVNYSIYTLNYRMLGYSIIILTDIIIKNVG